MNSEKICKIAEFENWPKEEEIGQFYHSFTPFISRRSIFNGFRVDSLRSSQIVDVSVANSVDDNSVGFFNGDTRERELIKLELYKYVDAFTAAVEKQHHWLLDSGLNLYLSQLELYNSVPNQSVSPQYFESMDILSHIPASIPLQKLMKINLWMNISPAFSSLHYDAYNNILAVQSGQKEVLLIPPKYTSVLKPGPSYSQYAVNHSGLQYVSLQDSLDLKLEKQSPENEAITFSGKISDYKRFLVLSSVPESDIIHVSLRAGDSLFIPEGWWHFVGSGRCTIALNYWFKSPLYDYLRNENIVIYMLRATAHAVSEKVVVSSQQSSNEHLDTNLCSSFYKSSSKLNSYSDFETKLCEYVSEVKSQNGSDSDPEFTRTFKRERRDENHDTDYINFDRSKMVNRKKIIEAEVLRVSLVDMNSWYPLFAAQHSLDWGHFLMNLEPENAASMFKKWESVENYWKKEEVDIFFEKIFQTLPDGGKEVRTAMMGAVDSLYKTRCRQLFSDIGII